MNDIELDGDMVGRLRGLGLTEAQAEVYAYLLLYTLARGYQPSNRDCMVRFGWHGTHALGSFLGRLQRKGWLRCNDRKSRAVVFLRQLDGSPFRGFVCAKGEGDGEGGAAEDHVEEVGAGGRGAGE